jgi:alpha-1,6-mannosyltransferase
VTSSVAEAPPVPLPAARTTLAAASLGLLTVSGSVLALAAAAPRSAFLSQGTTALPAWIYGPLSGLSFHATTAQFYIAMVAMTVGYVGVLALVGHLRARWVIGGIVAMHAVFLLAPPLLSTDVFNYLIYARMGVVHHLDPYAVDPAVVRHDPVFRFIHWRHALSAYGPLFTLGSYPLGWLSPAAALWSLKLVTGLASLGCVALVWRVADRLGRSPLWTAAVFGLNPMLLVWTVGGAHNDVFMLLGILGGVALVLSRREALGGGAVAAAVAIKASAGIAIPFIVLGARHRWRALAGVGAGLAVAAGIAYVAFTDHAAGLFTALGNDRRMTAFDSVPNELARLFGLRGITHQVRMVSLVALVVILAWLVVRVWRGADWIAACGWAALALVALSSWFLAWYTVWPLPFAALSRDRRLLVATVGLQLYFVANHLPLFPG